MDLEHTHFLDEKAKQAFVFSVHNIEKEIEKIRTNLGNLGEKHKEFEEQATKALSLDLEKLFPAGSSGGGNI